MWFGILTLLTALTIAGVAAWFSIAGLMAIFSAAALPIAVMAGTLEVGKLLTASWLYRYWNDTSLALKAYLSTAVLILMLITSMGIFGYLSKAHLDQAGVSGDAIATVERIDGQIAREENRISIIEDRIAGIGNGGFDVQDSIDAQIQIRDTAWEQVQGDIDYNQGQIDSVRTQLTSDLNALSTRLDALDQAVNDLREKGVEVITTEEGGTFRRAETETIDYGAQADVLRGTQQKDRDEISDQQKSLRTQATADIKVFQDAIDRYRSQAQETIQNANAEINRLRNQSTDSQDDMLDQIDTFNTQIDDIYGVIATLKDEKFEAESEVRELEKEVGPIKYVAQLLFGGDGEELLDKAVQVFILMLVFVFDPLAVMLVIAANQTLLRYGINLEKAGPDDDGSRPSINNDASPIESASADGSSDKESSSKSTAQGRSATHDSLHIQQVGTTGDNSDTQKLDQSSDIDLDHAPSKPSAVDDAATAMMESAAKDKEIKELKKELNKKPKKEIVVKEKIIEKEPDFKIQTPKAILRS
jgi:hypothetical protein